MQVQWRNAWGSGGSEDWCTSHTQKRSFKYLGSIIHGYREINDDVKGSGVRWAKWRRMCDKIVSSRLMGMFYKVVGFFANTFHWTSPFQFKPLCPSTCDTPKTSLVSSLMQFIILADNMQHTEVRDKVCSNSSKKKDYGSNKNDGRTSLRKGNERWSLNMGEI